MKKGIVDMAGLINRRLLLDFSHVVFRNFFMSRRQIESLNAETPGSGFFYLKFLVFQSLFLMIEKFGPTEVILAIDGRNNWRKKIYSEYKADRKVRRDKDTFDWVTFFNDLEDFTIEIKQNFPFKVIVNNSLEADDIAGWFARERNDVETILATSDKDWKQLLKYPNMKMYDPIKKTFIKSEDPEQELKIKILTGDKGDNVPPIRRGMGPKTAQKILLNEELYKEEISKYRTEIKRNAVLIDLKYTPKKLLEKLSRTYDEYEFDIENLKHLYSYFSSKKMNKMTDRLVKIQKTLSSIEY